MGLDWLGRTGSPTDEQVAVSKYYEASESWTGTPVWWFEFAARDGLGFINLLCQTAPNDAEFHRLRVPKGFLLANKPHLGFRYEKDIFSLYLSAEAPSLFRELRGDGGHEFGVFITE
jgi:hypothetical protein